MSNVVSPATTTNFRDLGDAISPSWLMGPVGQRFRYSMSTLYDGLADGMGYAIRAGLPHYAPSDALTWIGADRQILQGPSEPIATYINRLAQWLDYWRHAGSNMGVMLAMLGYLAPAQPQIVAVQAAASLITQWQTYTQGQNPFPAGQTNPTPPTTYQLVSLGTGNWSWDSASQPFYAPWMSWRTWIVIFSLSGSPWAAPSKTWATGGSFSLTVVSDATYGTKYANGGSAGSSGANTFSWGDGTCWGWAGTPQQALGLTGLAKQWKSAANWIPWIIVSYDATMFDQTQAFGSAKLPDGTWGYYGKVVSDATYGTKYVAARPAATTCTMLTGTNDGGGVLGAG